MTNARMARSGPPPTSEGGCGSPRAIGPRIPVPTDGTPIRAESLALRRVRPYHWCDNVTLVTRPEITRPTTKQGEVP